MRKIKIFCLIVSFQLFSSFMMPGNNNPLFQDSNKCAVEFDKTKCSAVDFEDKTFQCCSQKKIEKGKDSDQIEEKCAFTIAPLQPGIEEMETENGKIMLKEISGMNFFRAEEGTNTTSQEVEITCKDGNLNMAVDINDYSEEEKARFKSDNLCLRFLNNYKEEVTNENICYDSIVATATETSGVSCGFFKYTLYFGDGTKGQFKTCFLFNNDIFKTKNLGYWTKTISITNALVNSLKFFNFFTNYKISFSNSNGDKLIYDSATDTVIEGDFDDEEEEEEDEVKDYEIDDDDEKEEDDDHDDDDEKEEDDDHYDDDEKEDKEDDEKDDENEDEKEDKEDDENEDENEGEKEDDASNDSDSLITEPNGSSKFIIYRYLFLLYLFLI